MRKDSKYLAEVRMQYENYPYPRRRAEDEKSRIERTPLDALDIVNYHCFAGKENFGPDFRALVAGGGTGDATIYLAEQMRETGGTVTQIDMSEASLAIAKERARIRGLNNITFIHDSLLELPNLELAPFDYINCCGVLHHLENPETGLGALKSVLKETGAMGILLYGKYGRASTYVMQDLMRLINEGEPDMQKQVENAKLLLEILPETNWTRKNRDTYNRELAISGDIGIYDLFLHSQDRAYSAKEMYEFARSQDLEMLSIIEPYGNEKNMYAPRNYIKDQKLLEAFYESPLEDQQTFAEIMNGGFTTHSCYLSQRKISPPDFSDRENIPFASTYLYDEGIYENLANALASGGDILNIDRLPYRMSFKAGRFSRMIFQNMDGRLSIAGIIEKVKLASGISEEEIYNDLYDLYNQFNSMKWLLLKDKNCNFMVKTPKELQKFVNNA